MIDSTNKIIKLKKRKKERKTNQPTWHQISRQGLYVTKKAYFGAKMAVFGPHILIILGGSKGSGTYISENHLGTLFELSFWSDMAPKESERPVFGPK